ncbi:hypothetical protein GY45DRAFT_1208327, partial [Cubamyces sp. BRFM 1775]
RLRRLLDYADNYRSHYSLSQVPLTASWDTRWVPSYLTYNNRPLRIRVLGTLVQLFYNVSLSRAPVLTVHADLLRTIDHWAMVRLLCRSHPRPREPAMVCIFHSCRYTLPHLAQCFRSAFDATDRLRPRSHMATLSITDFAPGDLVMVDCACTLRNSSNGTAVHFELLDIYLIARVPR